jgi:pimeloyl-ACP methyl ester carboxylesterase
MRNGVRLASAIAAAAFLAMIAILAAEQNGPPPHEDVVLQGEIPATFYMPGSENRPGPNDPFYYLFPIPPERRPPGVLLIHGFTGDRVGLSTLARRLARNGYGVLAIDLRGHGANRNPFSRDLLRQDVAAAIAIVRHSMGAGAALDYAASSDDAHTRASCRDARVGVSNLTILPVVRGEVAARIDPWRPRYWPRRDSASPRRRSRSRLR